ncbi:MAG: glycosyltransferase family 4 protein [Gemmataceae bacterium]
MKFGAGEPSAHQDKITSAWHEYRKGGRIIRWLVAHNARAVVVMGYNDPGRVRIIRWCHRHRIPVFLGGDSNIKGDTASGIRRWVKHIFLPSIIRRCNGILACGILGREYFQKYGASPNRIWYVPYEPDYDLIASATPEQIDATYRQFDLPRNRRYIIYCGRLIFVKRVDLLTKAFADIARERPDWDLIVVGDGPLRAELENSIPRELRSRCHWLGFLDDQATIARLQRGARVAVLPSDYEPWGVVVGESVAAGLATIVSDVVGTGAELVQDGVNGRVFQHGDQAALTAALRDATDTDTLERYSHACATVLKQWRDAGDPVAGLAAALASAGVTG